MRSSPVLALAALIPALAFAQGPAVPRDSAAVVSISVPHDFDGAVPMPGLSGGPFLKRPVSGAPGLRGHWTRLDLADPMPRESPATVFDPVRHRLVVFGGFDGSRWLDDTWVLDDGAPAWRRLDVAGPLPPARARQVAIYDPVSGAMIVYGGFNGGRLDDLWALDLRGHGTWRELPQWDEPRPNPRDDAVGVFDALQHRLVVAGGEIADGPTNDVWAYDLASGHWTMLAPQASDGMGRSGMALAFDSRRGRWLAYGGESTESLFAWDVVRDAGWARLEYEAEAPAIAGGPCAVYDSLADRLVVMGSSGNPGWPLQLSVIPLSRRMRGSRVDAPGDVPPALSGAAAVFDPIGNRVLLFGGRTDDDVVHGDFWQLSLGEPMRWTRLASAGPGLPPARAFGSSVYDAPHHRWVVMFGWSGTGPLRDVWNYDLVTRQWSPNEFADVGGFPQAGLWGAASAYDAAHDRVLISGGFDGTRWYQSSWQFEMSPVPNRLLPLTYDIHKGAPVKRWFASAFYDPVRDRMLLFSGRGEGNGGPLIDTWILATEGATATWTPWTYPASVPRPHLRAAGVYDSDRDRLVIAGGQQDTGNLLAGIWSVGLSDAAPQWRLDGSGIGSEGASAVYDAATHRMLVFGGNARGQRQSALWEIDPVAGAAGLRSAAGAPPPARMRHGAAFDAENRRMLVYGGVAYGSTNRALLGDVWQLDVAGEGAWLPRLASPVVPEQRSTHVALYDAGRDRLVMFGGVADDTVWSLPLGGPLRWSRLVTPEAPGTTPGWRHGASFAHDTRRDRAILIGGSQGGTTALNDSWALSLDPPAWSPIVPRDSLPPGVENAAAVYDSARDEVVSFGGDATLEKPRWASWEFRPGAYALSLADPAWRRLESVNAPDTTFANQAAALEPSGRILAFGGLNNRSTYPSCEGWTIGLDGTHFTYERHDSCAGPPPAYGPTIVRDPARSLMLLYDGSGSVWARPDDGSGEWTEVSLSGERPLPRQEFATAFDGTRQRMLVCGGYVRPFNTTEVWAFSWDGGRPPPRKHPPLRPHPPVRPGPGLAARVESPARGAIDVAFSLVDRAPARLELYDLAGRRVVSREVTAVAGEQRVRFAGGAKLPPGVYLVRLRQGGESRVARVVLLEP